MDQMRLWWVAAVVVGTGCSGRPAAVAAPRGLADAATAPLDAGWEPPDVAPSLRLIAQGLSSSDLAVRLVATESLGGLQHPSALKLLARQLGDPEEDVRATAVEALGERREEVAIQLLVQVRDDEQEALSVRILAATEIVQVQRRTQHGQGRACNE